MKKFNEYKQLNLPEVSREVLAQKYVDDESKTITDLVSDATVAIGEKISIRRFARFETKEGAVESYIHMGGKIGVLVETKNDNPASYSAPAFKAFYHDVALQIAAARPSYVRKSEVPSENLNKEKEILRAQALNEGKPEKIVDKMVEGRIEKYYKEVCLLEQPFVKDGDISVQKMIDAKAKGADVVRFTRYKMGEGLEKKVNDLAAEVAAQTAGMAK